MRWTAPPRGPAAACSCQGPWSCSRPGHCPRTTAGLSASLPRASERASRRTWRRRCAAGAGCVCLRRVLVPGVGLLVLHQAALGGGGGVPSAPGWGGDGHRTGPTPGLCLHPEHVGACGCLRVRLGGPSRTPPNTPSSLRLRARRPGGPVGWARRAWAPGCGPSAWSATRRAWCTTAGTTWSFSGGGRAGGGRGGGASGLRSRAVRPGGPLGPSPSLSYPYSDITEEDLEEAGVQDPAHKRLLLDTLQLSK